MLNSPSWPCGISQLSSRRRHRKAGGSWTLQPAEKGAQLLVHSVSGTLNTVTLKKLPGLSDTFWTISKLLSSSLKGLLLILVQPELISLTLQLQ